MWTIATECCEYSTANTRVDGKKKCHAKSLNTTKVNIMNISSKFTATLFSREKLNLLHQIYSKVSTLTQHESASG